MLGFGILMSPLRLLMAGWHRCDHCGNFVRSRDDMWLDRGRHQACEDSPDGRHLHY